MELLLELLPDPELGYEGTGTGGAGGGQWSAHRHSSLALQTPPLGQTPHDASSSCFHGTPPTPS